MNPIALVGIDLGKSTFHVHAQDRHGKMVLRRKFGRVQLLQWLVALPSCTVAMEACGGAHYLARQLSSHGHTPRLIAAQFVRPFVKSNKNDFIDAEAICEAASRDSMRFVSPHSETQQVLNALHRVRETLVADRVRAVNQIHAFLLEYGVILPRGEKALTTLAATVESHAQLASGMGEIVMGLHGRLRHLDAELATLDRQLATRLAGDELGQRLQSIPGIGPITASVLCARMGDGSQYTSARAFAASLGLVPAQHSTGGRSTLLGISKRGDPRLRSLLVQCARSWLQRLPRYQGPLADWVRALLQRRHGNTVACALANKLARIAWAVAVKRTPFRVTMATTVKATGMATA
jgi:transposase